MPKVAGKSTPGATVSKGVLLVHRGGGGEKGVRTRFCLTLMRLELSENLEPTPAGRYDSANGRRSIAAAHANRVSSLQTPDDDEARRDAKFKRGLSDRTPRANDSAVARGTRIHSALCMAPEVPHDPSSRSTMAVRPPDVEYRLNRELHRSCRYCQRSCE